MCKALRMIDQLKRYWIGLLVVVLVSLHGAIVAMIRMEASAAKQNWSCEVDLGMYVVRGSDTVGPLQLRVHSLSPLNHRIQSRRLIEQNAFQIRQAIEEYLRQTPSELLQDPVLADLKLQIMDIMIQTVGKSSIEEVLITDLRPVDERLQWTFGQPSHNEHPRVVITRREEYEAMQAEAEAKLAAEKAAHAGGHGDGHGGGHGDGHGEEAGHGDSHGDSHGGGHGEDSHGDASHGHDAGHGGGH